MSNVPRSEPSDFVGRLDMSRALDLWTYSLGFETRDLRTTDQIPIAVTEIAPEWRASTSAIAEYATGVVLDAIGNRRVDARESLLANAAHFFSRGRFGENRRKISIFPAVGALADR